MKHLVVLSGAGISAESGIKTFRDANGLWEGHDIMEVASPQGFKQNPKLVLEFYNQRRQQLLQVQPNQAHVLLADLEKKYKVSIITQNVDDLYERAGSTNITHLHGELLKARSTQNNNTIPCKKDINLGDLCPKGHQLRPHIVWFGEAVPMIDKAITICNTADILLIIGTSLQVYPAANLIAHIPEQTPVFLIDPNPSISKTKQLTIIPKKATKGMPIFMEHINSI